MHRIYLQVIPHAGAPEALVSRVRPGASSGPWNRDFPLRAKVAPDLFRLAFDADLGVFGELTEVGDVAAIDPGSLRAGQTTVSEWIDDIARTARVLVGYGRRFGIASDVAEVEAALRSKEWPTSDDPIVQSAAFLVHFAEAFAFAATCEDGWLVWFVDDGKPSRYFQVPYPVPSEARRIEVLAGPPPLSEEESTPLLDLDARRAWVSAAGKSKDPVVLLLRASLEPSASSWSSIGKRIDGMEVADAHRFARWLEPFLAHWPETLRVPPKKVERLLASDTIPPMAALWCIDDLRMQGTGASDLEPFRGLRRLRSLDISNTAISDLSPLAHLDTLTILNVSMSSVTGLDTVRALVGLESLYASKTAVDDLAPLRDHARLESVAVQDTRVTDVGPLESCPRLRSVNVSDVKDLGPLAGCVDLREVFSQRGVVANLDFARRLPELEYLSVTNCNVSSLEPLAGRSKLRRLSLVRTSVENLEPLAELRLETLAIPATRVRSLAPLARMTSLRKLYIWGSRVEDLSPLAELDSLEELWLRSDEHDLRPIAHLVERGLKLRR